MTIELNYEKARELRYALGLLLREIDCVKEEEEYNLVQSLYDEIDGIEDELEED